MTAGHRLHINNPQAPRDVSGSVFGPKYNHDLSRFGRVRCEIRQILIVPTGKVYDLPRLNSLLQGFGRFHDVEPVAVEEERVISQKAPSVAAPLDDCRESLQLRTGSEFVRRIRKSVSWHAPFRWVASHGTPQRTMTRCRASHLGWSQIRSFGHAVQKHVG